MPSSSPSSSSSYFSLIPLVSLTALALGGATYMFFFQKNTQTNISPPATPNVSTHGGGLEELAVLAEPKIYKFVLTGGPCSGKTTALERLQSFLRERGFRVFSVPEAATVLFLNGASPDDWAKNPVEVPLAFQQFVISVQMTLEDRIYAFAKATRTKAVLLCDRGVCDGSAYVDDEMWDSVLRFAKLDRATAWDRYDTVLHLVTAADGADSFYTLANNAARHETPEEAIALDKQTQKAWQGHPQHIIIDNRDGKSFEQKLEQLVSVVASYVGLPSLTKRAHKFLLSAPPRLDLLPADVQVQVFDVEKIMLKDTFRGSSDNLTDNNNNSDSDNGNSKGVGVGMGRELYSFVRKRSQGQMNNFGLTTIKELADGKRVELKQVISSRMYMLLTRSANQDNNRHIIRQRRYCFIWERQSFQIVQWLSPQEGLYTMRVQCEGSPVLPPSDLGWFSAAPVVDNDNEELTAYNLSLKMNTSTMKREPSTSTSFSPKGSGKVSGRESPHSQSQSSNTDSQSPITTPSPTSASSTVDL